MFIDHDDQGTESVFEQMTFTALAYGEKRKRWTGRSTAGGALR
jgi:hypothetical protein